MDEQLSQERIESLRERESKLVRIVEAIDGLLKSSEWRTLKEEILDDLVSTINTEITLEVSKPEISLNKLYRLQGKKDWAQNYADLALLRNKYFKELLSIRKLTPGGGAP